MKSPNDLFVEAFRGTIHRLGLVDQFRRVARISLQNSRAEIEKEAVDSMQKLTESESFKELFRRQGNEPPLRPEHAPVLGKIQAEKDVSSFQRAVDSASLVFAHAALDAALMDFCTVTAKTKSDRWERFVKSRKIDLEQVRNVNYQSLLEGIIEKELATLERESLMKKADRLIEVCHPSSRIQYAGPARFDRDRLNAIDGRRHAIVHGPVDVTAPLTIDEDLKYILWSFTYFVGIVSMECGVRPYSYDAPSNQSTT